MAETFINKAILSFVTKKAIKTVYVKKITFLNKGQVKTKVVIIYIVLVKSLYKVVMSFKKVIKTINFQKGLLFVQDKDAHFLAIKKIKRYFFITLLEAEINFTLTVINKI